MMLARRSLTNGLAACALTLATGYIMTRYIVMPIGTSRQISLCVYPICPDHTHRWPDASPTVRVLYNNDSDVQPSLGRYARPGGHTVLIHAPLRRHHRDQPPVVCLGVGGMRCMLGQFARHAADQLSLPSFDPAAGDPQPATKALTSDRPA